MKRSQIQLIMVAVGLMALSACASPEEKAARDLERQIKQRQETHARSMEVYQAGVEAYQDDRLEEALSRFNEAVDISKENVAAHTAAGITLYHQGDKTASIEAFRRAVALAPSYYELRYNLGTVLEMDGQYSEAIYEYRTALELNPDSLEVKENLVRTQIRSGIDIEKTRGLIEEVLQTESRNEWRNWLALQLTLITP